MINKQDAIKFIKSHIDNRVVPQLIKRQGEWSTAFTYSFDGQDYVIRFSETKDNFERDKFAAQFASTRMPVPQIIEIGEAPGGYFAISVKAEGDFFENQNHTQMVEILPALFDLFDAMREVDLTVKSGFGHFDKNGNGEYKSWKEFLLSIIDDKTTSPIYGWKRNLAPEIEAKFNEAYVLLEKNIDNASTERHLIHSDLLYYNLLVNKNKISAVLDWGSAKYGDFLYDLAWFSFWSHWYPAMEGREHFEHLGLEVSNFKQRMLICEIHIGLDSLAYSSFKQRQDFARHVAAHLFKRITILQAKL